MKEAQLIQLLESGKYTYPEIAKLMGNSITSVRMKGKSLGITNATYLKRIKKYSHQLRVETMTYFLTHTFEECMEKFGLTRSQLKSIQSYSYRDPKLSHLRKDSRRKDPWTLKEMLFLLRNAGVRERGWIAKRLNRGCAINIKERLQKWNAASKHLNGMPLSWARELWPYDNLEGRIRTKAGPAGQGDIFRIQLIPWHECLRLSRKYPTPDEFKSGIRAMVRYQGFIYGTKCARWIRRRINNALKET